MEALNLRILSLGLWIIPCGKDLKLKRSPVKVRPVAGSQTLHATQTAGDMETLLLKAYVVT